MRFRKKSLCLAGAALLLAGSVTAGNAMAYFTTNAAASGGGQVSLGFTQTEPNETFGERSKHITVANTGEQDCFVRVKIFAGATYQHGLQIEGSGWTLGEGGYYHYENVVAPGTATPDELVVTIDTMGSEQDFNVIVVQESTPVLYDESGAAYADWDVIMDTVREG